MESNELNRNRLNGNNSSCDILYTNSNRNKKQCFFCKKNGHVKNDCYKYKQWLKNKNEESHNVEATNKKV